MAFCFYCDEKVTDDASAHLISSNPFELAHPACAQRYIDVTQVKPGKVRSGTLYAEDMNGHIYKCDAYVAGDDMAFVVAGICARGFIRRDMWTLVRSHHDDWEEEYRQHCINPEQLSLGVA